MYQVSHLLVGRDFMCLELGAIGLLRRLRDSARIVETASVVDSEICTDGFGKQ